MYKQFIVSLKRHLEKIFSSKWFKNIAAAAKQQTLLHRQN